METASPNVVANKVFEYAAISAAAVQSTRSGHLDLLLLQPEGNLVMWVGYEELLYCQVSLEICDVDSVGNQKPSAKRRRNARSPRSQAVSPQFRNASDTDFVVCDGTAPVDLGDGNPDVRPSRSPSRAARMVDLVDPVGDRVNVIMSNGLIFRLSLDFLPKSDLIRRCLAALRVALPPEPFQSLRMRLLRQLYDSTTCPGDMEIEGDTGTGEWTGFVISLWFVCGKRQNILDQDPVSAGTASESFGEAHSRCAPATGENDENCRMEDEDWNALVAGAYHQMHRNDPALRKLRSPSSQSDEEATLSRLFDCAARIRDGDEWPTPRSDSDCTGVVITALHLVYEELKIFDLARKDTQLLGALLVRLASMVGWETWVEYYLSDGIHSARKDHFPRQRLPRAPTY
ncbi:MAG: hypothetical protein BJ554DRAFT_4599 [Olpidium bornovanus]|uniref:Anaphase-promoting complex subunit 1 N-terminal domain-containing protein n=1 Tax=Olpidium bornovanus TaxID=278681 RepID=A0A8H7ZMK4_9FUNG|nr:MAG: hypothetical protein BJ554DRAFT_4599 [Olpidium bornovanus]